MSNIELLEKWQAIQASNKSYDWHLGERIVLLKHEIETGKRICPTCKGASEIGSPCGTCGIGTSSI